MKLANLPKLCACGNKKCKLSDSQRVLIKYQGKNWPDYKKVIDGLTGKAYKVPVAFIIRHPGFKYKDLPLFEKWPDNSPGATIFS